MQHIFAYNGLPWGGGLRNRLVTFSRRTDVKLLTCNLPFSRYSPSNGFLEAPKPTPLSFLVSHLDTTKRGKDLSR